MVRETKGIYIPQGEKPRHLTRNKVRNIKTQMHNLQRRLLRKHFRTDQVPDDYCIVICSVLRKYKKSLLRMMKTKLGKERNFIELST